jgi:two-component system NarL family sensor kinase
MLKKWSCILIVFLAFSQDRCIGQDMVALNKDSLLDVLKTSREDTARVLLLIKIGNDFERNQPDSAIYFYKAAGALSRKLHYDIGVLKFIANYTAVLNMQGKLNESLDLNTKAVDLARRLHNDNYLGMAYGNTAAVYTLMHMHKLSIEYYLKCIAIFEHLHNEVRLCVAYANLASIYADIDENEKAIWYGFKSITISRQTNDAYNLEGALNNTANAFAAIKKYDTALVLYNQARTLSATLNDQYVLAESLVGIAEVLHAKMLFAPMKQSASLAYSASRAIDYKVGMAKSIFLMAEYYFETRKYAIARNLAEKTVSLSVRNGIIETEQKGSSLLADISLAMNDLRAFHDHRNRSDSLANVMVSSQVIQNTQELETEYSLAKKEATITDLTKIQQLQKESIVQAKKVNAILSAFLLAVILSAFLFYRNYAQKKKLLINGNLINQQRISELEKEKQLIAVKAVLDGQEQERERLARDLHDGLGSVLSGIKLHLVSMQNQVSLPKQTSAALDKGISNLDGSIVELRRIAHNLMPEAIVKFGLVAALEDFCESINQSSSLQLTCQSFNVSEAAIPLETSSVIFRMTQELIQNVIKHAQAANALVQLMGSGHTLTITVEDDGMGLSQEYLKNKAGIGFSNIQNRLVYLHGRLDISSSPGNGTSVTIELPNIIP